MKPNQTEPEVFAPIFILKCIVTPNKSADLSSVERKFLEPADTKLASYLSLNQRDEYFLLVVKKNLFVCHVSITLLLESLMIRGNSIKQLVTFIK